MFEFGDKFGTESRFDWAPTKTITTEAYPETTYYKVEKGNGWKNSTWEKVYKILRKRSATYLELITPYDKDKKYSYTLQSTNGRGHSENATASTTVNLSKYEYAANHTALFETLFKHFMKNEGMKAKLHIISDFFDNKRNRKLNDLGRAINLIHEAVHANLHYDFGLDDFQTIVSLDKQHHEMQKHHIQKIRKALREYDSRLTENDVFILSMAGLTGYKAGGNVLIAEYSNKILGEKISVTDEEKLEKAFDSFLLQYQTLTEGPYKN